MGTDISFVADSEIDQSGRVARFERWEKLGVDTIEADLKRGGTQHVGGPPAVRALAREWVQHKRRQQVPPPAQKQEVLSLKPGIWGVSIDLKELWRRGQRWWRER